jgi:outer membrane protein assembly factor BamD (BamD/ComL family)
MNQPMNISAISSTSSTSSTQTQSIFQKRAQDLKDLQDALKTGDLSGAQTAFAALQKDLPSNPAAVQKNQNSPGAKDFQALQTALQSGDLSGAQQAFANLKQDVQSAHKGHHHHHQDNGSSANSAALATNRATASPAASFLFDHQA